MSSKKIGLIIFWIGALYMFGVGFILSWWVVPAIREAGLENISFPAVLTIIWSMSAPLGAVLVAIGASLYAGVERLRVWLLVIGSIIIFALPAVFSPGRPIAELFGVNGGLITVFFLGIFWNWARSRPALSGIEKTGSDLQMMGHLFFLMAAWWLCGLLGAPFFTLRPNLLEKFGTLSGAVSTGSLISILLVLGWAFMFFGQRMALREKGE